MENTCTAARPPSIDLELHYTKSYCEENIYHFIQRFTSASSPDWKISAVFISNADRSVALWSQKASIYPESGHLVIWDYHVIALAVPNIVSENCDCWVYDYDTTLPWPCLLDDYLCGTFDIQIQDLKDGVDSWPTESRYRPMFRVVEGSLYLNNFASDRSHMLKGKTLSTAPKMRQSTSTSAEKISELQYLAPCPLIPAIQGPAAKALDITHNLMTHFVTMQSSGIGKAMGPREFAQWAYSPNSLL